MFEKYPLIVSRYEELSEAIVQPDIIADTARYQAYLKERSALEEQVTAWQAYQSLLRHREQAQGKRNGLSGAISGGAKPNYIS